MHNVIFTWSANTENMIIEQGQSLWIL